MTSELDIHKLIFIILPYVLCSTLAALIIWEKDIKPYILRFIIYSLIAAIMQFSTELIQNMEFIRFLVEVAAGYLIAKIVFRESYLWTFKIYAMSYLIGYFITITSILLFISIYDMPFSESAITNKEFIRIDLIVNLLGITIAYLIRRAFIPGRQFLSELREKALSAPAVFFALFLQTVLFIGLLGQITFNYKDNYKTIFIFTDLSILFGLSIYILIKYVSETREEKTANTEIISENILEMINRIRSQRHDFINNLQIIAALNHQGNHMELNNYLNNLLMDVSYYNEILRVDNPIIASLLNAKISQAKIREIDTLINIEPEFSCADIASMEVARIVGNLIDNAIDAAEKSDEKWLKIDMDKKGPLLFISVANPFCGDSKRFDRNFKPGITSKAGHDGLGLYTCQRLINKIGGKIEVTFENLNDNMIKFTIIIPQI